ncbi:MAG: VOC family protein, partial [Candidatus Binataceae bacterium]
GREFKRMAQKPIGKLDHIGIAVRSIAEARKFFEDSLGARPVFEHQSEEAGWRLLALDLNGLSLELLEPMGENSFLHKFLNQRGEGLHHLTFDVPDVKAKAAELRAKNVRVVDEKEWSPSSYEAFISPRSAHGVLIQLGSGYPTLNSDPRWKKKG